MYKTVVIVGGGMAGLSAAKSLAINGFSVFLIEKESKLGGHAAKWHRLFPYNIPSGQILSDLTHELEENITIKTNCTIENVKRSHGKLHVVLSDNSNIDASAIILATGFQPFDASKKEEYGYELYPNVITSVDLEYKLANNHKILTSTGTVPEKVALIHCVGSRDEKINNLYCSKVCCAAAVNLGIELKKQLNNAKIYSFYMDMRMFGPNYEELYREAQEHYHINFIRGRLSECSETIDKKILLKSEDTLSGKPLQMTVDLLVLMVGMESPKNNMGIFNKLGIELKKNKFIRTKNEYTYNNLTNLSGVFAAGACTSPMTVTDAITDGKAAAMEVISYLKNEKLSV